MMEVCEAYRNTQVTSARPENLVVMVYNGAIRFIKGGCEAIQEGDYEQAGTMFTKAQDIVVELRASLNSEAGSVADNLDALYEYIQDQLIKANVKKDEAYARNALEIMEGLHEAWVEAVRMTGR